MRRRSATDRDPRRVRLIAAILLLSLAGAAPAVLAQAPAGNGGGGAIATRGSAHVHSSGCRRWVEPREEWVIEKVWRPGTSKRIWIAPVYRTDYTRCGNPVQVLVQPGRFELLHESGHFEDARRRVRVPGKWIRICGH